MIIYQRWIDKKKMAKIEISILTFMFVIFLASVSLCSAQNVGWEDNFSTGVEEWYDEDDNDTFNCRITALKDGTARIEEIGETAWGKVAKVVVDVDLDKYPIVEVKANHVDVDSAFKIGVASLDWSEYYDVITGQNLAGVYSENIIEKTEWSDMKPNKFNLVIIIEGFRKGTIFDYIRLKSLED